MKSFLCSMIALLLITCCARAQEPKRTSVSPAVMSSLFESAEEWSKPDRLLQASDLASRRMNYFVYEYVPFASYVTTPIGPDTKEVFLGKMLLGSAYSRISQNYNVYYAKGPTSASSYGGWHPGIDYSAAIGKTVYSPVSGTVFLPDSKVPDTYGRVSVKITGTSNYFIFLHLSKKSVVNGQVIRVNDVIGKTGEAGSPGQPHLHVELRRENAIPAYYFKTSTNQGTNLNPASILQ